MSRALGRIKSLDKQSGLGLICGEDGRHVFVHASAAGAAGALKEGDWVEFDWAPSACGLVATRVDLRPRPNPGADAGQVDGASGS